MKKTAVLAVLVSAATIIFTVENAIGSPFPWVRLGLANAFSLLALVWWGPKEAFSVLFMRIILGGLLSGRFLQPVFILSLSGSIVSMLGMWLACRFKDRVFSITGISITGALLKNVTQLFVVYLFYIQQPAVFRLAPIFLLSGLAAGFLIGFLVYWIDRRLAYFALSGGR